MTASTDGWIVHPVTPGVVAEITREMPALPPDLDDRVSALWEAARADHALFNGRVFSVDRVTPGRITGHWSEYRRIVAQMQDPALRTAVGVRNLAVCGVITGPDGVLLGRRTATAIYQPGMWQLPPAGSVDGGAETPAGIDLHRALMLELHEELGLGPDAVQGFHPLCLIEHPGSGVSDLGIALTTRLTHAEIIAAHAAGGDGEYDRLISAPADRLLDAAARAGGEVVPPVVHFLRALRHAGLAAR